MGMDRPRKALPVTTWSNSEYCRTAEYKPIPIPIMSENAVAVRPRTNVLASALRMSGKSLRNRHG